MALHIGAEISKVFALVLVVQVVIFGAVFTLNASRDYGFDLALLLPIFRITFAYCLYYTIPISALMATGLVFGRLIADREVAALKSFGVSHLELVLPPACIGLVLATGCFFINGYLIPEVRFAKDNLGKLLLDQLRYMHDGYDKNFFLDDDKKNKIVIERFSDGILSNIFLFAEEPDRIFGSASGPDDDEEEDENGDPASGADRAGPFGADIEARAFPLVLHAEEGEVVAKPEGVVVLELRGVHIYYDNDFRGGKERRIDRERRDFLQSAHFSRLPIPIGEFDDKSRVLKAMPNPMLSRFIREKLEEYRRLAATQRQDEETLRETRRALNHYKKARATYQKRITFALISLTFPLTIALIALALDSTNRLLPFFVGAVTCCTVFFPLEMQGYELAKGWDAPWVEHLGNAALLLVAAVLYLRLETPAFLGRKRRSGRPPAASAERGET